MTRNIVNYIHKQFILGTVIIFIPKTKECVCVCVLKKKEKKRKEDKLKPYELKLGGVYDKIKLGFFMLTG